MQDRPTERVRVLLDGLTASAIVDRVHPYYSGYQFEGEWLDTLKESIEGELDDLDRTIRGRAGTVGAVDRLREYVANAPASSMGEMARAIVTGMADEIEREVADMVPLPVDADGVPIHVGDVVAATLAHGGSGRWLVDRMELTRAYGQDLWQIALDKDGACWVTPSTVRHHHAPTVEDVLREFGNAWAEWKDGAAMMNPVETFAAKLRLAGEDA